jgi:hypothetical protein
MQDFERGLIEKTREWREKEQVLGKQVRTNIARPREQLTIPSNWDGFIDNDTPDVDSSKCILSLLLLLSYSVTYINIIIMYYYIIYT